MSIAVLPTGPLETNTLVVPLHDNYVFVVDPAVRSKTAEQFDIVKYLAACNLIPVAVVLTHGHFDHVLGLSVIKHAYPDIKIMIHKDDAECIGKDSITVQEKVVSTMGLKTLLEAVSNLPEPDCIVEDGKCLGDFIHFEDADVSNALNEWTVIHTPGHTPGSICLYNKEKKVLISGDTVFFQSYGRTDLYGGDDWKMQESIQHIFNVVDKDACVYPGHGNYGFPLSCNY